MSGVLKQKNNDMHVMQTNVRFVLGVSGVIMLKTENECPHVTKLAKFKLPSCPKTMFWNTLCRI